ncbi:MAG: RNA polymerase sigma factor [Acidimicrobiales bacterium]
MGIEGSVDFRQAFDELYPQARRLAYRILGNPSDAEDAAAESLTRALTSWKRVGPLQYREAWVLRVTANVAIDMRRRQRPDPGLVGRNAVTGELEPTEDAEDAAAIRMALTAALSALPRRQREVIVLRHLVGMREAEVAACLGVSVGSVKRHAHRAVAGLRVRLGEDWEGAAHVAV